MLPAELLARYGTAPVPRYTSYPSANHWAAIDDDKAERFAREAVAAAGRRPASLYVHVPFCRRLCFYCGCNMMVTHDPGLVDRYLGALEREVELVARAIQAEGARVPPAVQVHLGGGTPTFLDEAQLRRLVGALWRSFSIEEGAEMSVEVHPAVTSEAQLATLASLGFSRVSMGVQDFDPEVQAKVNRPQPFEETRDLVAAARRLGFTSVNIDLMYGLPLQTAARFDETLARVEEIGPDRIALFGFAHMPRLKKHHKLILAEELPDAGGRLAIFERAVERLLAAGYVAIGLDHFARPDDELCKARADGTLRRNFMGYTTCAASDVLAFGPSSISEIEGVFLQNEREVRGWAERVEAGRLPVVRGFRSSADDRLRADLIQRLFCSLEVDTADLGRAHDVDVDRALARELEALRALEQDGLVERQPHVLRVTSAGQLLLRNVAAVFDAYLDHGPRAHAPAL